jgi:hypothetical protein
MDPQTTLTFGSALFILGLVALWAAGALLQVYGIYTSFIKKWYFGVAALVIPGFALVVGAFKFFGKKDILT